MFTSTRQFFQFIAEIVILAVFAEIAEIPDLVGALFDRFPSTRRFFQIMSILSSTCELRFNSVLCEMRAEKVTIDARVHQFS